MRRSRPRRPAGLAALALSCLATGAVTAQDRPPDDIGSDLLDAARNALPGGGVTEPAGPEIAGEAPLVAVPHPDGGMEVFLCRRAWRNPARVPHTALSPGR